MDNIRAGLLGLLRGTPCRTFGSEIKVWMPHANSFAYPDFLVICGERRLRAGARDVVENPVLIGEVLSASTAEYERTQKFGFYRSIPELRQYVLAWQDKPRVEVFTLVNGFWVFKDYDSMDHVVSLDAVGVSLSMSAIYEDISFHAQDLVQGPPAAVTE